MQKRWLVDLSEPERSELGALTRRGNAPARKIAHARVLLLAADGLTDEEIAAATGRSRWLVERTRKRFVLSGLQTALWDKPRRGGMPKLDERGRATLIALACANPPEGRTCWTMQLLANELVVRQVVPSISDETVRRELKKRTQALASGALVHTGGQPELRSRDGGRARAVRRATTSTAATAPAIYSRRSSR